jgi:hypothetical protein
VAVVWSSQSGVEFLFVEIKLLNRVALVATIYWPLNTSVVYHSLNNDYGLHQALEEIYSDLLPLYGEVCLLGDFNVDLLDPGNSLFPRFLDFLEMLMWLCGNVAIFSTRGVSGKLLDLFLVSNPNNVGDFHQIAVPWSEHDMISVSCCFERLV